MLLRPYQQDSKNDVSNIWVIQPKANILLVKPCGAGKTVTMGSIIHDNVGAVCAIAHRQELVGQISQALAREGVTHRIIGPKSVITEIVQEHVREFGRSWYDPSAAVAVAGVDTLIKRVDALKEWMSTVTLWVVDEAHHILTGNKWGRATRCFPNARGLGVTATPDRADGGGLGRHADGVFDEMVVGPSMRWLIDQGYLTDYRIFAPPSDLDLNNVDVGKTGDFSNPQLKAAAKKSHIIGDVVLHYQRICPGKKGVVFATDIETATDIAARFNAAGTKAACVSSKTKSKDRLRLLSDFRNGVLDVLVNVDLFGEGFDLPAIEVVIMARPTMSFALYIQQFGRALRLMEGKEYAIIIDHVGNVTRHGLPDRERIWSLDRKEKTGRLTKDPDLIPVKTCRDCLALFEATHDECPFCGYLNFPMIRSGPEQVDGDLIELLPDVLAQMRGEIAKVDKPTEAIYHGLKQSVGSRIAGKQASLHADRQIAQKGLREVIALWAGHQRAIYRTDSESYRRFYWRYGVDVMTAQALNKAEAEKLTVKIANDLLTM